MTDVNRDRVPDDVHRLRVIQMKHDRNRHLLRLDRAIERVRKLQGRDAVAHHLLVGNLDDDGRPHRLAGPQDRRDHGNIPRGKRSDRIGPPFRVFQDFLQRGDIRWFISERHPQASSICCRDIVG
jgi:hypothetical protein